MKSVEVVITPLPYTTRIDSRGDFRMSSHTALVTDATASLYKQTPNAKIFIPGESTFGSDYPTTAELMKAQLVKKGVPAEVIDTQDNLNDTESQLQAIKNRGIQSPTIVNMEFHDGRVNALRRQLALQGKTVLAESVVLQAHKGATKERLSKFAATKSKILGMSRVLAAETIGRTGVKLGNLGKAGVNIFRRAMKADGATVTDYNVVEPARQHFDKAMKDSLKRERILAQKKEAVKVF